MTLRLPSTLTPSKVSSFKACALAFRFSAIDRLPEPPSVATVKGSLVHRALESFFWSVPAERRDLASALGHLEEAWAEAREGDELGMLELSADEEEAFGADAESLVRGYFELEDPRRVNAVGIELLLEAHIGTLHLRGIIDRLDLDEDGELVVTDYKTGRVPGQAYEQGSLGGVHFYAFLCQEALGRRPVRVQLLYLRDKVAIVAKPSEQSLRGLRQRAAAVWAAVERACEREDFRPHPSALCAYCAWQTWCPAFGGDPALAGVAAASGVPVPVRAPLPVRAPVPLRGGAAVPVSAG